MNQQHKEIIDTLKEYVPNLRNGILQVIDEINHNNFMKTANTMSEVIEGFQWVDQVLTLTDLDNLCRFKTFRENKIFEEIIKAYEIEDEILAKDLIKYELLPVVEEIMVSI